MLLLLLLSRFSHVRLCATPETGAHCLWDSPGKNTGVGCHFLLQCMKVKSKSEVAQSCLTLSNPMDCSLPGSSVHGTFQARVLEWVPLLVCGKFQFCGLKLSRISFQNIFDLCLVNSLDVDMWRWRTDHVRKCQMIL